MTNFYAYCLELISRQVSLKKKRHRDVQDLHLLLVTNVMIRERTTLNVERRGLDLPLILEKWMRAACHIDQSPKEMKDLLMNIMITSEDQARLETITQKEEDQAPPENITQKDEDQNHPESLTLEV